MIVASTWFETLVLDLNIGPLRSHEVGDIAARCLRKMLTRGKVVDGDWKAAGDFDAVDPDVGALTCAQRPKGTIPVFRWDEA